MTEDAGRKASQETGPDAPGHDAPTPDERRARQSGPIEAAARAAAAVRDAAEAARASGGLWPNRETEDRSADPGDPARTGAHETAGHDTGPSDASTAARSLQLRLAHVHLRTGAFALARTELETIAGQAGLDLAAMLDLAEVRWRTGDLAGAGEAAASYVAGGGDEALGFVIAAETAAAADRPAEARRLAGRALERNEGGLDTIFGGMPRSLIWPHDTTTEAWIEIAPVGPRVPTAEPAAEPSETTRHGAPLRHVPDFGAAAPHAATAGPRAGGPVPGGLWDVAPADPLATPDEARAEVAAAASALAAGDSDAAAVHLGVALRLAPTAAAAVLETIGGAHGPALELVRGDALRLLGYEWDARRAYLGVAATLREARATEAAAEPSSHAGVEQEAIQAEPPETGPANSPDKEDT